MGIKDSLKANKMGGFAGVVTAGEKWVEAGGSIGKWMQRILGVGGKPDGLGAKGLNGVIQGTAHLAAAPVAATGRLAKFFAPLLALTALTTMAWVGIKWITGRHKREEHKEALENVRLMAAEQGNPISGETTMQVEQRMMQSEQSITAVIDSSSGNPAMSQSAQWQNYVASRAAAADPSLIATGGRGANG